MYTVTEISTHKQVNFKGDETSICKKLFLNQSTNNNQRSSLVNIVYILNLLFLRHLHSIRIIVWVLYHLLSVMNAINMKTAKQTELTHECD